MHAIKCKLSIEEFNSTLHTLLHNHAISCTLRPIILYANTNYVFYVLKEMVFLRRNNLKKKVYLKYISAFSSISRARLPIKKSSAQNSFVANSFMQQIFPSLTPDASPEEELNVRETRYWSILKNGHARFMAPLCERRDVLSAMDYLILFQNQDELLKLSEEIRDEGGGVDSYLCRVPKITAAYRRYLSGLQRACCLLVALRQNTAFAKLVCEPAVPHKRRPDLTGVLLLPLEHYRLVRLR